MTDSRWLDHFSRAAQNTALLSYAKKLKVGAVAVRDNRGICDGFNGTAPGDDNTCEDWLYDETLGAHKWKTRDGVEHAERNLIAYAAKKGIALEGASLFITHSPCIQCARMIRNVGIKEVYFKTLFSHTEGVDYLRDNKIPCTQHEPELGSFETSSRVTGSSGTRGEPTTERANFHSSGAQLPPPWE
jgi:dCMP deaminase